MNLISLIFLLVASPVAAFESDLEPFLQKRIPSDPEAPVPVVVPVDPKTPFPKLPPVEAMLNTSSHTVNEIDDEVTKMEQRVHSIEKQDQAKLAEKKADFDAALKAQDEETRDVIAENAEIAGRIIALHKSNQALRDTSKELIAENQAMRGELRAAGGKVATSSEFIKASQKSTDDRHAKALAVLSEGSKVHRRQNPVPVSEDSEDATESQEPSQNEDATSEDAVDSSPKDVGSEDKPKGLVSVFRKRSKNSGKTKHESKDDEKKEEDDKDDKDDDDKDDDSKDDDKDDDKDDGKDDAAESFMQVQSRRSEESMEMESEESDSEESHSETHSSNEEPIFGQRHGVRHKNRGFSENIVVDGASKNMLSAVSHELKDLAEEDEQGLERQAQIFHSELVQEKHAYKAALAQQRALNKTEASLLTLQSKLRRAVSHLQVTKGHLQQRLRGLGQYLQHLAHLLLAPSQADQSAASLIGDMPQEVPIPEPVTPVQSAPAVQPAPTSATSATLPLLAAPVVKR